MKFLAALLLTAASFFSFPANATGISATGTSWNKTTVGGGGGGGTSANIAAAINCRSFGQTASSTESSSGTLNIKYATPMMCWASATTVSGIAINSTGWVPNVFVSWNWDDGSLGTVNRAGINWDLGKSVGLIAAHAFKPSVYAESCNGGTNSLHVVTATISSVIAGVRESDSATMNVCVENPDVTWAGAKTICYNDGTLGSGCPAGATDNGDATGSAALAAAIRKCETDGDTRRILFKGGVLYSTSSTNFSLGSQSCYIGTYGTGKAELNFTDASRGNTIFSMNTTCGGYRIDNVFISGTGDGNRMTGGGQPDSGCIAFIDSGIPNTAGKALGSAMQSDPTGAGLNQEFYFIKFDYQQHGGYAPSQLNSFFIYGRYIAFVGTVVTKSGEHNIRFPQANFVVVDATYFDGATGGLTGRHLLAIRNDCGGTGSCPNSAFDDTIAVTRNEFRGDDIGSSLIEMLDDGSGTLTESAKTYDVDFIYNIFAKHTSGSTPRSPIEIRGMGQCGCGEEFKRVRLLYNALDAFSFDSSASRLLDIPNGPTNAGVNDMAFIGNVLSGTGDANSPIAVSNAGPANFVANNNVCFENGSGSCGDIFPNITETGDNVTFISDPWDRDGIAPPTLDSFNWSAVLITHSSSLVGGAVTAARLTDIEDEAVPQSADLDKGVDDE